VLLELTIKQRLNLITTGANGGHDLPGLIHRLSRLDPKATTVLTSKQRQLSDSLRALHSQGKDGTAQNVPSNSYPHMRYLRHSSDWQTDASSDDDIIKLLAVVQSIEYFLKVTLKVTP
jgi:hypothetical protein